MIRIGITTIKLTKEQEEYFEKRPELNKSEYIRQAIDEKIGVEK